MRQTHWHVAIGHPDGMAYAVSEYSDPHLAIRDFMNLSKQIYSNRINDPIAMERAVNETAEGGDFCISIGMDMPLMILCTTCDCKSLPQSN